MEGVANAPMMASVEIVVLTSSDSNQRSRMGLAAPVRISMAFWPSAPSLRKFQAVLASRIKLPGASDHGVAGVRSEEHTSELQSRLHLVCRLLLEKKKKN